MKLYYTSSVGQNQIQSDCHLSLGGYQSASPLPNNAFGAMFDEITQFLLSKTPQDEFLGIVLHNETGAEVDNLWLYFEYPDKAYSKLLVAAVDMSADVNGILAMEHIPTRNSQPLAGTFYEADGVENALSLGTIPVDGMIGLWFCRRLTDNLATTVVTESNLYQTDSTNSDLVIAVVLDKTDTIAIRFVYGSEYYYGAAVGDDLI